MTDKTLRERMEEGVRAAQQASGAKYVRCACGQALSWPERQVVPEPPAGSEWLTIGIVSCEHEREAQMPPRRAGNGAVALSLDSYEGGVMAVYIEPLPNGEALVRVSGKRYYPEAEAIAPRCDRAAPGWWCSRNKGHEGPCAARPL